MKIVKYLIATLLVISLSKKVHVAQTTRSSHSRLEFAQPYQPTSHIAYMIDRSTGMHETYVGVIQVDNNFSNTLPDASIPALKFITKMPKLKFHDYKYSEVYVNLYGIPVSNNYLHVKSGKKTIGLYWPDNKIVQLYDGKTYVGIIEQNQKNYKKNNAIGPVFTWFDTPATQQELLQSYGISQTNVEAFKKLVTNEPIGTVRRLPKHKSARLYGVYLDLSAAQYNPLKFSDEFITSHAPKAILKQSLNPNIDRFRNQTLNQILDNVSGLYKNIPTKSAN